MERMIFFYHVVVRDWRGSVKEYSEPLKWKETREALAWYRENVSDRVAVESKEYYAVPGKTVRKAVRR